MKRLSLLLVIICSFCGSATAQSKIEFGLTTEGSWFIPGNYTGDSSTQKSGLGASFGVYASKGISGKLWVDVGVANRFKEMKEYYKLPDYFVAYDGNVEIYVPYGTPYGYGIHYDFSNSGKVAGWKSYSLNYLVIPIHLKYLVCKNIFVQSGIEVGWLINYTARKDNPELNWTLGFGSQQHKLKWSVNYIRGFNEAGFANKLYTINGMRSATVYRNNMLQLSLSYPIWQKK